MIFNWPSIKEKCQNILTSHFAEFELSKFYYLPTIKEEKEAEKKPKMDKSTNSEDDILNEIDVSPLELPLNFENDTPKPTTKEKENIFEELEEHKTV